MNYYEFIHARCDLHLMESSLESALKIVKQYLQYVSDGHGSTFEWYDLSSVKENDVEVDHTILWETIKKIGY